MDFWWPSWIADPYTNSNIERTIQCLQTIRRGGNCLNGSYDPEYCSSPIRRGFALGFVNYKKWCTRLAAASEKVYQLLAHGRWFSPDTLASSTTKTGRHDIAEILLKVALKHQKSINQSNRNKCKEKFKILKG